MPIYIGASPAQLVFAGGNLKYNGTTYQTSQLPSALAHYDIPSFGIDANNTGYWVKPSAADAKADDIEFKSGINQTGMRLDPSQRGFDILLEKSGKRITERNNKLFVASLDSNLQTTQIDSYEIKGDGKVYHNELNADFSVKRTELYGTGDNTAFQFKFLEDAALNFGGTINVDLKTKQLSAALDDTRKLDYNWGQNSGRWLGNYQTLNIGTAADQALQYQIQPGGVKNLGIA